MQVERPEAFVPIDLGCAPGTAAEQPIVIPEAVPVLAPETPTRSVLAAARDFVSERIARSRKNSLRYAETCERRTEQRDRAIAAVGIRFF